MKPQVVAMALCFSTNLWAEDLAEAPVPEVAPVAADAPASAPAPLAIEIDTSKHPRDPWEGFNRKMFRVNQELDRYILKPLASGYRMVTPEPVDRSVTNFFNNLRDVVTLANQVLQIKPKGAAVTTSRIMFNTTWGLGGLFDVATKMELERLKEDFGQTMNYWGVPQGNYLMLPLLGPNTVTDAIGKVPDSYIDPTGEIFGSPESSILTALRLVDKRADLIPAENLIVGDKYIFVRNAYLQQREFLINDGVVEDSFLDEDLSDF